MLVGKEMLHISQGKVYRTTTHHMFKTCNTDSNVINRNYVATVIV